MENWMSSLDKTIVNAINERDWEKVRYTMESKIFNIRLKDTIEKQDWNEVLRTMDRSFPVEDFVFELLFLSKDRRVPLFKSLLESNEAILIRYFIRRVPLIYLIKPRLKGYINFAFCYDQKNIPKLMKYLSEEKRTDVIINEYHVQSIEARIQSIKKTGKLFPQGQDCGFNAASENPRDYFEAITSVKKYCVQVATGYQIKPQ